MAKHKDEGSNPSLHLRYQILTGRSISELERLVNHWMKDTWVPIGGPMLTNEGFAQAMINTHDGRR